MAKNNFIIYGSYGYTGNLIAEIACKQGFKPVLAGRNKEKLSKQATQLGLDYRVFDVADLPGTKQAIRDFIAVIHCAGPFIETYQNMVEACLDTQTHYLDITGEYLVIEEIMKLNEKAKTANVMLLPGAGFDVVPSDCLAQYLKSRLPDAQELVLAIKALQSGAGTGFSVSRGTAKTMVEGLASDVMIRDKGVLQKLPRGVDARIFDFGDNKQTRCINISWGDLASAWWSTHIPHIETFMSTPAKVMRFNKMIQPIKFIFKWQPIKRFIQKQIDKMPEGPSNTALYQSITGVYGEVKNAAGKKIAAIMQTPNGYLLTALTTILIIKKIFAGNVPTGFQTPSTAYTQDLILEIPGVKRIDL